jgi:hypothetical protein
MNRDAFYGLLVFLFLVSFLCVPLFFIMKEEKERRDRNNQLIGTKWKLNNCCCTVGMADNNEVNLLCQDNNGKITSISVHKKIIKERCE